MRKITKRNTAIVDYAKKTLAQFKIGLTQLRISYVNQAKKILRRSEEVKIVEIKKNISQL